MMASENTRVSDGTETGFDEDCIFCRIARGDSDTPFISETANAVAFADISPQAPVHVLVIPRRHVPSLDAATETDQALLGELLLVARGVGESQGVATSGYRVQTNIGPDAGQTIGHLHFHVMGGDTLGTGLE